MKLSSPTFRSNHPEVFCEKGVLRNFGKFTGKHLCQNLFLIKLQACEFSEISKNTFFYRTPPVAASVYSVVVICNLAYSQLYHWQSLIVTHNLPSCPFITDFWYTYISLSAASMFKNHWKIKTDYSQLVKSVNPSRPSTNFYQNVNVTNVQMFRQILNNRLI